MLNPVLPSYDRVMTGYSSHREESTHALAFRSETAYVVFANYDPDNNVQDIWLDLGLADEQGKELALTGLLRLARIDNLMLVDWNIGRQVKLSDSDELKSYIDGLMESRAHGLMRQSKDRA